MTTWPNMRYDTRAGAAILSACTQALASVDARLIAQFALRSLAKGPTMAFNEPFMRSIAPKRRLMPFGSRP